MGRRHFKPEQIIHMLREAEIKLAGGKKIGEVCRELGISEQSYYRWRKEPAGAPPLRTSFAKVSLCDPCARPESIPFPPLSLPVTATRRFSGNLSF